MSAAILGSLLRVDLSRVAPEIIEGLRSGRMILSTSNGNVYWATGSGGSGIAAQLPLVPVSSEEVATAQQLLQVGKAVKSAQMASMATTAVAAAVVVAVVVVATVYLAGKIERVNAAVRDVSEAVGQQDLREQLRQVTEYAGEIASAQELLGTRLSTSDMSAQVVQLLPRLAAKRHQTLLFVRGLPAILARSGTTPELYEQGVTLMREMLDLIPSALSIERELCLSAGLPTQAQNRRERAAPEFRQQLKEFQQWTKEQFLQAARGDGGHVEVLQAQRVALNHLFDNPTHSMLLDGLLAQPFDMSQAQSAEASAEPEARSKGAGDERGLHA